MSWALIGIKCAEDVDPLEIAELVKEKFLEGFAMEAHFQGEDEAPPAIFVGTIEG